MVEGLLSAAEMAEFAASSKLHEAEKEAEHDPKRASDLRQSAQTLEEIAKMYRQRAGEVETDVFVPIDGDVGPGWVRYRRKRRTTLKVRTEGSFKRFFRWLFWPEG